MPRRQGKAAHLTGRGRGKSRLLKFPENEVGTRKWTEVGTRKESLGTDQGKEAGEREFQGLACY